MNIGQFKKQPILGILRGIARTDVKPLVETIMAAGLETIEITMNTKDAPELIADAVKTAGRHLTIGSGTVLDVESCKKAIGAGATFIVMPILVDNVVQYCVKNEVPVFPGALTPAEIHRAWQSGATMVKVFPAGPLGPAYFKEIKGPFPEIKLLACGGVTPENLRDYFSNGTDAVAFGASVFKKEWLANKDFVSIKSSIKKFLRAFSNIR